METVVPKEEKAFLSLMLFHNHMRNYGTRQNFLVFILNQGYETVATGRGVKKGRSTTDTRGRGLGLSHPVSRDE